MFGALSSFFGSKKDSGRDAGNAFVTNEEDRLRALNSLQDVFKYQGSNAALDPLESSRIATQEVQNNPLLSQLFGKGGALERTNAEEQQLASRGYSLQPEDYEAYGQAQGNIAREFDMQEGNLAQALASRGMSNSGAAAQAFAGSQGNKLERLKQMQMQIADQRMNMNMQRLNQTRQFMGQLGAQGANAIQNQFGRQQAAEEQRFGQTATKANVGMNLISNMQGQSNEQLSQRQQTQRQQPWAGALSREFGDWQDVGKALLTGGASGGTKKPQGNQAGTSYNDVSGIS